MADNINYNQITGKHAFYSKSVIAWHKKGQISQEYLLSSDVIVEAQLNFPVEKWPNTHNPPTGESIISDNSFFTYRTDTNAILGDKVGKDYTVVQNIDA